MGLPSVKRAFEGAGQRFEVVRKAFLVCGLAASVLYAVMNVFVSIQWPGYSSASQTVSELSAIGAPTRPLWVPLGILYALLMAVFGWGVWKSAGSKRTLRVAGGLLTAYGLFGLAWPPMHQRAVLAAGLGTLTDTLHLVRSFVTVVLMLLAIGFAAAALDRGFRIYSALTILTLLMFGILTSLDAPRVGANLPTPWIGVWERIDIGAFLLWVMVFAVRLLPIQDSQRIREMGVAHASIAAIRSAR
jgi:hypothetical protein